MILPLRRPLRTKVGEISELRLREPTAGEVLKSELPLRDRVTEEAYHESQEILVSVVTGIALDAIAELPVSALAEAHKYLHQFGDMGFDRKQEPGTEYFELELDPPITTNSAQFTRLELREPTSGEAKKAKATLSRGRNPYAQREYEIAIVSLASGAPRMIIERLPISKLNEAAVFVQGFISAGQVTISN